MKAIRKPFYEKEQGSGPDNQLRWGCGARASDAAVMYISIVNHRLSELAVVEDF